VKTTKELNEKYLLAEKNYFLADRALLQYAQTIEDIYESKKLLEQLETEKYKKMNFFLFSFFLIYFIYFIINIVLIIFVSYYR
jgi:predicted ATP-dependent endonuclease of OLD family